MPKVLTVLSITSMTNLKRCRVSRLDSNYFENHNLMTGNK